MSTTKVSASISGYFARVDERLAELTAPDAKRALLDEQYERWAREFEVYQAVVNHLPDDKPWPKRFFGVTAHDFHDTLDGLNERRCALMVAA